MNERTKQDRFMDLLRPLYPRLERYALTITRDRDDAKDVVGETVLVAFEQFDSLRSEQAFLSYLFTIASRTARRRLRRRHEAATDEQLEELFDNYTQPDMAYDIKLLYEAMDKLPSEQREAVIMAEIIGLSHKEIQETQGGTVAAVKVRVFRAKRRLAKLLGVDKKEKEEEQPAFKLGITL